MGCAGDAHETATAPTVGPAGRSGLALVRETTGATIDDPLNATMGATLQDLARVRVVSADGRAHAGAAVRFFGETTDTVVVTDASGLAVLHHWRMPHRDTTSMVTLVRAALRDEANETFTFVARAWRDLSHFGGDGPAVLERLPIERAHLTAVLPLGTFDIADEGLPSAHAHLLLSDDMAHTVHAMADGLITALDRDRGTVTMRVRDRVRLRLEGLHLRRAVWVGQVVRAGDTLGEVVSSAGGRGLAVQVLDASVPGSHWIRPERYGARGTATFFARYLVDSLRSNVYALVRRAAPDLAGRIDYDRPGRLVGSWFDPVRSVMPLPVPSATPWQGRAGEGAEHDPTSAAAPFAFTVAYDAERPGQVRLAIGRLLGATLGLHGVYAVAWEDPDPALVDMAQGIVPYHLYPVGVDARSDRAESVLLVQVLADDRLRVELTTATLASTGFSSRAIELVR